MSFRKIIVICKERGSLTNHKSFLHQFPNHLYSRSHLSVEIPNINILPVKTFIFKRFVKMNRNSTERIKVLNNDDWFTIRAWFIWLRIKSQSIEPQKYRKKKEYGRKGHQKWLENKLWLGCLFCGFCCPCTLHRSILKIYGVRTGEGRVNKAFCTKQAKQKWTTIIQWFCSKY